eukprot:6945547-Alexandrium_andersonii.AAC.1
MLLPPHGAGREVRGARRRLHVHRPGRGPRLGPEPDGGALPVQGGGPTGRGLRRLDGGETPQQGHSLDAP